MKSDSAKTDPPSELRRRAEARLRPEVRDTSKLTSEEVRRLVQELQTHQIELEMQNEELRRSHEELVESRDRYSDLYDFAPVGYATLSVKGLILETNLTLAGMLGVERQSLLGRRFSAFLLPEDQDLLYQHRRNLLESKRRGTCRLRMLRHQAKPLWVELDSIWIETGDPGDGQMRIAISDISEQKRVEAEKLAVEQQMQQAQKLESLGVLAGGIAHDFNNLLMAILANASVALYELSPESPLYDNLRAIEKASTRAGELTNQMLSYSGKGRFVIEPIDANELIRETAHLLSLSRSKKCVLGFELTPALPTFDGDATQIRQIIMNLITNASEAIGDNSGTITLATGLMRCDTAYLEKANEVVRARLAQPLSPGPYIYFEVADTGCGMNTETLDNIFDPFFTTKFTGRGLGMSAVLGIVSGHRGTLEIHSELGRGTTFKVFFPANALPAGELSEPGERREPGVRNQGRNRGGRMDLGARGTLLFADDEESLCTVCGKMLETMGFRVLIAHDGKEALQVFRDHADEIACVILDLTMPKMDGAEAYQEMRRLAPELEVILCSGYNEQRVSQTFTGQGPRPAFLQKPFKLAALAAKLSAALGDGEDRKGQELQSDS